jgi:hypothetical protein
MGDRELAEIICRALIMCIRALNSRFGFEFWILSQSERKEIVHALEMDTGPCAQTIERIMTMHGNGLHG